ncbi:MAG: hypothetical protein H7A49_08130 [Akkermansiaceae bacterium]|nr:hypothetical protein [Akkermansiaceae bacterium]
MHHKTAKKQKRHSASSKFPRFEMANNWEELNQLAQQLNEIARFRLRDGVLNGVLGGREAEIRQDAILMVLDWYLRRASRSSDVEETASSWASERLLAKALAFVKKQHARQLTNEADRHVEAAEWNMGSCFHHYCKGMHDWPEESKHEMLRQAIHTAVHTKLISHSNASIALLVLRAGEPVPMVAERLGVKRGAIYQRLHRVREKIAPIIANLDPPSAH